MPRVEIDHSGEGVAEAASILKEALSVLSQEAYREDHGAAELYRDLTTATQYTHLVVKPDTEQ
jgi:hypothetical protein